MISPWKIPGRVTVGGAARAVTLVEMLLALTIGSLAAASAATVAVQAVRTREHTEASIARRWARFVTGEIFARDFGRRLGVDGDAWSSVTFPDDPGLLVEVLTLTPEPSTASSFRCLLPAKITYRVEPAVGGGENVNLVREVVSLTAVGGAPARSVVAEDLRRAAVEVFAASGWIGPDGTNRAKPARPRAIRLVCEYADSRRAALIRTVLLERSSNGHGTP